jgi:hypothetical protein
MGPLPHYGHPHLLRLPLQTPMVIRLSLHPRSRNPLHLALSQVRTLPMRARSTGFSSV